MMTDSDTDIAAVVKTLPVRSPTVIEHDENAGKPATRVVGASLGSGRQAFGNPGVTILGGVLVRGR
ncbi:MULTISPECIES: hypothetical protein [Methylobacterium]|uniref:hypothetical protein n=1 Tax=Methylobacterium TaxID=407 RepID=UPI0013E9EA79|nr:hypothetical protein [Methylobacterium sp. DB0501]NGM33112.1 hypothetical protein [Methylobacterium sp. DB0501]